ncbi:MAG: hydrolase [Firmicutes bacterium]|nr:hydrolase [Bacillota bacterium]
MENQLTAEEKLKPYAKYFYREPAIPDAGLLTKMDKPIDSDQALLPENINDLLNPGYMEVEAGWCILPNGAAFAANHTKMPGVTVEMINWWFAWHALEDLRYKIWWPAGHYSAAVDADARKKILDPERPVEQKFQGLTHHVVEDVGAGKEDIFISFQTPENMGFDMKRFKAPNVGTLVAANGVSSPLNAPAGTPKAPAVMCHFVREIPGGVEFRTRFWIGYHFVDKKPKLLLPPGIKIPEMAPKGLAMHNVFEYTNLAAFLPELYREQKGIIE